MKPTINSGDNVLTINDEVPFTTVVFMYLQTMKTNPLLNLGGMDNDFMHDSGMSDSERNNSTLDSNTSSQNIRGNQVNSNNNNIIATVPSNNANATIIDILTVSETELQRNFCNGSLPQEETN